MRFSLPRRHNKAVIGRYHGQVGDAGALEAACVANIPRKMRVRARRRERARHADQDRLALCEPVIRLRQFARVVKRTVAARRRGRKGTRVSVDAHGSSSNRPGSTSSSLGSVALTR